MSRPTREQLLVLVDRAERGRLSPAEADRLRAGIAAMDVSRRSAAGQLGLLRLDMERTRERLAVVHRMAAGSLSRGRKRLDAATLLRAAGFDPAKPPQRPPEPRTPLPGPLGASRPREALTAPNTPRTTKGCS